MKDKYGTEIVVDAHVTDSSGNYGEITALEVKSGYQCVAGDEDLMVKFEDIDYDVSDDEEDEEGLRTAWGEADFSGRLIVCEGERKDYEVTLTFDISAFSKNEAYDKVKDWMEEMLNSSDEWPDDMSSVQLSLFTPRTNEQREKIAEKVRDTIGELGLEFSGRSEDIDLVLEIEDDLWTEEGRKAT